MGSFSNQEKHMSLPAILTIGEAARYSGLHRDLISTALHRGELPFREIEGRKFINPDELVSWLEKLGLTMLGVWK
jgi:excisionase family DNA binding protein